MPQPITVRAARDDELASVAGHYLGMRHELGWPDGELREDWLARFVRQHADGQRAGELRAFVAFAGNDALAGSALAIVRTRLSVTYVHSAPSGYLANVYVDPRYRRLGIAKALTVAAIDWLRAAGCDVVRLVASDAGRPLYASLGFEPSNEMMLGL